MWPAAAAGHDRFTGQIDPDRTAEDDMCRDITAGRIDDEVVVGFGGTPCTGR